MFGRVPHSVVDYTLLVFWVRNYFFPELRILHQTDHPFSSETDQCSPVKAISVLL